MSETKITFTLNRLVNALNASADRILREKFNLTFSQFQFLVTLESLGAVSSSELAQRLGVSKAAISKRISWFAERHLIVVGSSPTDSRIVTLTLSNSGSQLVTKSSALLEEAFRAGSATTSDIDLHSLNETLLTLLNHLNHNENGK